MAVLKVETDMITSLTASQAGILVTMYVETLNANVIVLIGNYL